MKIFLGWSGTKSHAVARALAAWIPSVIQAAQAFVSPEDVRKGKGWAQGVSKELDRTSLGILCVVPGNPGEPWLNFEAGVLAKSLDASNVIPLLIDVERSELDDGPLAQFPHARWGKEDVYRILERINEGVETMRLSNERLRGSFEVWWPKLKLDVDAVMGKGIGSARRDEGPEKVSGPSRPDVAAEPKIETAAKSESIRTQGSDRPAKPAADRPALQEIEMELLKVLSKSPGDAPMTAAAVGYKLDISAQKVREHLDTLERKNYVHEHLFGGRPKEYSVAPKGKEYVIRHGRTDIRRDK